MQNTPLVTIVALCYNQSNFVVETLNSIKNQTYTNVKLVIFDDASTDESCITIQNWINLNSLNCVFIKHNINIGLCKTLNESINYIEGQYFQHIACDDIMDCNKIQKQIAYLEHHLDIDMVYTDALLMQGNGKPHYGLFIQKHKSFIEVPTGNIYNELLEKNHIPAMSILLRKEVIEKIGGWDENLAYEDYDYWLRLAKVCKIGYIDEPLVTYRLHSGNLHKSICLDISKFYIYKKHTDNPLGQDRFRTTFLSLYSKQLATKDMKKIYCNLFKHEKGCLIIKLGFGYYVYKLFMLLLKK